MSKNTIAAYRDAFRLFLLFCDEKKRISPDRITLSSLTKELVIEYLDWLELERECSIITRNQRLSSIHGFLKYVQKESPENLFEIQMILSISSKKTKKTIVPYLTEDELKILFQQPDAKTKQGRRDLVLLVLMYDSAARVQELANLRVCDIRLTAPAVITLHGKGCKTRQVPIIGKTKELLSGVFAHPLEKVYCRILHLNSCPSSNAERTFPYWGTNSNLTILYAKAISLDIQGVPKVVPKTFIFDNDGITI